MGGVFVDRFSAGLDDLTRKQQGSIEAVLRVLDRTGRFSVFEATENDIIARMMTTLVRGKFIETDDSCGYPWTKVKLSDLGRNTLAKASMPREEIEGRQGRESTFC